MARTINRLKALNVAKTVMPGLYPDGGGLYLQIKSPAARSWLFRYRYGGKERQAGLGSLTTFSLEEARQKAQECRALLHAGVDPIARKTAERASNRILAASGMTFDQCAAAYIAANDVAWKNAKHRAQWSATLTRYASPVFGKLPVTAIDTALVMKVLDPIWTLKPETASRLRGRIESVLNWAKVRGYRDGENPARWRGHMDHLLPAKSKVRKVRHHPALPYDDMPTFMAALRGQLGQAARALEFTILTAARTGEVIAMRQSELDFKAKLWTVPEGRMKAGREHRVPLSDAVISILETVLLGNRSEFVFVSPMTGVGLSNAAMSETLKRMNLDSITVHGFRSTFSDWVAERTNFPREVREAALAHVLGDKAEAAYQRGDLFEKRRRLMAEWARYCRGEAGGGEVVALRAG